MRALFKNGSRPAAPMPSDCGSELVGRTPVTSAYHVGPIADSRLRDDDPRRRRNALDLAPQVGVVDAQVLLWADDLTTPHGVEDMLLRVTAAAVVHTRVSELAL